ncbi:MAG: hypothetical protein L3J41_14030 [Melioribacteraceae bacterium]|nr:hypothetical protein [Melioribacteraceae bacterium]
MDNISTMLDKKQKLEILKNICAGKEFSKSKLKCDLLAYLVKCSITGNIPKETTIAIDVYGRDKNFNPSEDSIVRYNVHNLRNKLHYYYQNEGKSEKIRLTIPKGHYKVEFKEKNFVKKQLKQLLLLKDKIFFHHYIYLTIILLLIIALFVFRNSGSNVKNIDSLIWNDILANNFPIKLVFGDYFTFLEPISDSNSSRREIRDYRINSPADLEPFKIAAKNKNISPTDLSMLPHHTHDNLIDILPILYSVYEKVGTTRSSLLTWEDIKSSNIIYFGKFINLRILKYYTSKLNIKFAQSPPLLYVFNSDGDTIKTFLRTRPIEKNKETESNDFYNRDYALISKLPGPNGNYIFIFAGVGHISLIETVDMFTSQSGLRYIEEKMLNKFDSIPPYFEMLVEISGFKRTGVNRKIVYFDAIDPNLMLNFKEVGKE